MYNQKQYNAWMVELANYFVNEFNYQIITISEKQSEMWLVNAKSENNPIMLITFKALKDLDKNLILKHRQSLAVVFNVKAEGLNLSVFQDQENTDDTNVVVGPSLVSNEELLEVYPKLKALLQTSPNPERSFTKAVAGMRRTLRKTQNKARRKLLPVTSAVTAIIVAVFVLTRFLLARGIQMEVIAVMLGAYYKRFIVDGFEVWRLLSSGFLHVDFFHILMNMLALRNLGTIMERIVGSKRFLIILLTGIIFGNVFVFILDEGTIGLGLSGGLFALMGALIVYLYETGALKNKRMLSQMINIILINVLISMLPGVSFAAHLGGFQVGIIFGFIFSKRKDWDFIRKAASGLLAIMSMALVFIMLQNTFSEPLLQLEQEVIRSWFDLGWRNYAQRLAQKLF